MNPKLIDASEHWDNKSLDGQYPLCKKVYKRYFARPNDKESSECFSLERREEKWHLSTSYFIGVDWIEKDILAIRVSPKFTEDKDNFEIDYLKMLEDALTEPKNFEHLEGLLNVDFKRPPIAVPKQEDGLSLFLISEFIHIMARITAKGIMKSYYFVEENQRSKIKGKILLPKNLKYNIVKGNLSDNYCRYQEYGIDIPENRILKKAMKYCLHVLDSYNDDIVVILKQRLIGLKPKWKGVGDKVDVKDVNTCKINSFYKEYHMAIEIAKILLKVLSYNQVLHGDEITEVPPYWIDMTKLFEMFVFAKLRNLFGDCVIYHPHFGKQEPDYLIMPDTDRPPYVADAKYKRYSERSVDIDDIRQVSGYARLKAIRSKFRIDDKSLIPCVIIYPDQNKCEFLEDYTKWVEEGRYEDIFKTGIRLPVIKR